MEPQVAPPAAGDQGRPEAEPGRRCPRVVTLGGRHRAGLDYGDCFSYALATATGEPLLFRGDDFLHTDVPLVDVGALDRPNLD